MQLQISFISSRDLGKKVSWYLITAWCSLHADEESADPHLNENGISVNRGQ